MGGSQLRGGGRRGAALKGVPALHRSSSAPHGCPNPTGGGGGGVSSPIGGGQRYRGFPSAIQNCTPTQRIPVSHGCPSPLRGFPARQRDSHPTDGSQPHGVPPPDPPTDPLSPPPPTASGTAPRGAVPPRPTPSWRARTQRTPARPIPHQTAPGRSAPARRTATPGGGGEEGGSELWGGVCSPPTPQPWMWGGGAPALRRRGISWRHWGLRERGVVGGGRGGRAGPSRSHRGHLVCVGGGGTVRGRFPATQSPPSPTAPHNSARPLCSAAPPSEAAHPLPPENPPPHGTQPPPHPSRFPQCPITPPGPTAALCAPTSPRPPPGAPLPPHDLRHPHTSHRSIAAPHPNNPPRPPQSRSSGS